MNKQAILKINEADEKRIVSRVEKLLSDILSDKYDCKVSVSFSKEGEKKDGC